MTSAIVEVFDRYKNVHRCRILLDTCATGNIVTDRFANILKLPKTKCKISIGALNNLNTSSNYSVSITFKSIQSNFRKSLQFLTVPEITDLVPSEFLDKNELNLPKNIKLADPEFHKPGAIEMLIGAGPSLSLLCIGQTNLSQNTHDLFLQKTQLGWILGGEFSTPNNCKKYSCLLSGIDFDMEKFWEIENRGKKRELSIDDKKCEENFRKYVKRDESGRYVVALPFKGDKCELGDSKPLALKFLNKLSKRFENDKKFEEEYSKVLNEYGTLGHMTPIYNDDNEGYYLPHLAVIKETSNTTKLRAVFHASAKSSNGKSINDNLLVGPILQDDLFSHLIRFRLFIYVIIADIEKMYRQFLVRKEDRKYQKILWFVNNVIRTFVLNTVTFGFAPSAYLAVRCLLQLAKDEGSRFPLAAKAIENHLYVDNFLTGTDTIEEGQILCQELIGILKTAQLHLRQWASNDPRILKNIPKEDIDKNYNLDRDQTLKTLGLSWNTVDDTIVYSIKHMSSHLKLTKRSILSEIAKIFDPLGLLGPIVLYAKKIMQDLWRAKIDWDESVPMHIHETWMKFSTELEASQKFSFDRKTIPYGKSNVELHGFCDASQIGYGACIYLRSKTPEGGFIVRLLCSKSRVATLKTTSIPRLELCAALLLAELYKQVIDAMEISIEHSYFWSDSSITIHWINTPPNLLKVFVANRVAEIQNLTDIKRWNHVRSQDNPADPLSRGQLPSEFLKNKIWVNGPQWLHEAEECWPKLDLPINSDVSER